jgi:hypothetical protein
MRSLILSGTSAVLLAAATLLVSAHPAAALTEKECSAQYQAAKKAGTLNGQSWKDYRAANCAATTTTTPAPAAKSAAAAPEAPKPTAAAAPAQAGSPVFPDKIDPKYASLKAGTGRMKTCDDQYKANKATGGNAGMKWIQKGGGYYSACSKHLKGA